MKGDISARAYRARVIAALKRNITVERRRASALIRMGGEDPETGENFEQTSHIADGVAQALRIIENTSLEPK